MAKKFTQQYSQTAVLERPRSRTLLWGLLGAVLVVLILIAVLLLRDGETASEQPEAAPAPTAQTAEKTPVSPDLTPAPGALTPEEAEKELQARERERQYGFPMLSLDKNALVKDERGRMTYSGGRTTLFGIDVSEHQGDIDWKKVAADGVQFAMIRMGRRGTSAGALFPDEFFEKNIQGASEAGIPIGIYFYSQAVNPAEAKEEAEYVLEAIRDYKVTFPVVYDWEIVGGSEARTYTLTRREICDCASAFCDTVAEAGYEPMIYFTRYLGYRKYILRELTDYGFWYAEYEDVPSTVFDFDMWQFSDAGRVDGIEGDVDMNLFFK